MNRSDIAPLEDPGLATPPHRPDPPHRILVVDDDLSIRQLNTQVLVREGYVVDAADDGAAAWQALNAGRYDLLITDHKMPKVTGVELLKKLRAARMALPVIMVSGALPIDVFAQQPWLQPTATLLKPYAAEELLVKVQEVLRATSGERLHAPPPEPVSGDGPPS